MDDQIRLDEDWHVSSTFSSGYATVEENVQVAEDRGLRAICLVDNVQGSSEWVWDLVDTCRKVDRETAVEVRSGVEAEVLDTNGTLEVPSTAKHADHLFVAANWLPTPGGLIHPEEARAQIAAGKLWPSKALEWLVRAAANAAMQNDSVILSHPFSILPELGIDARNLHPAYVRWLAGVIASREAATEINELWHCASPSVAACFLTAGATVHASSGSTSPETVGRYEWCRRVADRLAGRSDAALSLVRG